VRRTTQITSAKQPIILQRDIFCKSNRKVAPSGIRFCSGRLQAGECVLYRAPRFLQRANCLLRFAGASAFCRWRCVRLCRRTLLVAHPPLAVIQPGRRSQRFSWRRREERLSRRRTSLRLLRRSQHSASSHGFSLCSGGLQAGGSVLYRAPRFLQRANCILPLAVRPALPQIVPAAPPAFGRHPACPP